MLNCFVNKISMSRYHQINRHKKGKGRKPTGIFGVYLDLLAKQVPVNRRRALLDSNAPLSKFLVNENEVLRKLAESMCYGVYGPCPDCQSWNMKHDFKQRGFSCKGEKDAESKCKFASPNPPKQPFTVPEAFHDIEFLQKYNFEERENVIDKTNEAEEETVDGYKPRRGESKSGYTMTEKTNDMFEKYYKGQGLVPEDEWDQFMEALRAPLPCTFRVTGYKSQARELLNIIKSDYFNELMDVYIEDKKIDPPKCLSWYPNGLAWQLNLERRVIRHNEVLARLKQFLVTETESGHISRQEAVSMIPPLVLDVKPHHKVLDMCAAPGSKTAQLIEALHADESVPVPEGFVVANDSDNKRCYLMVHQVKRLESPNFTIINHDASQLPSPKVRTADGLKLIKFDRVLADVPCSGDGTLRKNIDAWLKWNTGAGHNLHTLQSRILKRGLDILEVGGRLVYSTCTFNPIENEAVLASLLSSYEGSAELVDVSAELPGLRYNKGLTSWRIMTRDGQWFDKLEDVPEKFLTQIRQSMFPPTPEVAEQLHLDRCIRVLPHHQDTGGFFVAVIVKTEDCKTKQRRLKQENEPEEIKSKESDLAAAAADNGESESRDDTKQNETTETTDEKKRDKRPADDFDNPPPLKKQRLRGYKEDPFIFLTSDVDIWPKIKEFFGVSDSYPVDQLMIRCQEGQKRNLYFVSSAIKQLVQDNEDKIRFINHGVRMLCRSPSKYCSCDYRLVQEGVEHFHPHITKRIVSASRDDLVTLLTGEAPFLSQMSSHLQEQLQPLEQGSIVYIYDPENEPDKNAKPQCKMAVTGWLGMTSARTFLPKHDRAHYMRLCGEEFNGAVTPMERMKGKKEATEADDVETESRDQNNGNTQENCGAEDIEKPSLQTETECTTDLNNASSDVIKEPSDVTVPTDSVAEKQDDSK